MMTYSECDMELKNTTERNAGRNADQDTQDTVN